MKEPRGLYPVPLETMATKRTWSDEFQDYYYFTLRESGGKSNYDLVWGRSSLDPPKGAPAAPPATAPPAPAPVVQAQYATAASFGYYQEARPNTDPDPSSASAFGFAGLPQPSTHLTTRQPPDQQHVIAVNLPQRGIPQAPTSGFPLSGFIVPHDRGLATGHSSSASTEGPRAATPTTTVTQSPSIAESPWPRNPLPPCDDGPDTSVFQETFPTPDGRYETIQKPRNYFKKGRVFKVIWVEPRGEPIVSAAHEQTSMTSMNNLRGGSLDAIAPTSEGISISTAGTSVQTVHAKPRLFVVVRQKSKHCLCVPVYTYSQQATSKPGINPEDHAPLVSEGTDVVFHPQEKQEKLKKRLLIVVEDSSVQWSPLSRINFSKVHSVEYNLKVRTIGRIAQESTADLEASFREAIGLSDE